MFIVSESVPFEERTTQSDDQRERAAARGEVKKNFNYCHARSPMATPPHTHTQEGVSLSLSGVVIWYSALISRLIASREADSGGRPRGLAFVHGCTTSRRGQIQKKKIWSICDVIP